MIGSVLRELRKAKKYSLKEVYDHTKISDSRLYRFECGEDTLSFNEVIILIEFYESTPMHVLSRCGMINADDSSLKNVNLLNEYEINHIQNEIDFILKIKEEKHGL